MRLQAAAALLAVAPLVGAQRAADVSLEEKKRHRQYEEAASSSTSSSLLRTSDETKKKREESWKAVHLEKEKHTDDQQIGRECDPTQNMDDDEKDLEADLGFLSCDPDEECVESELSKTGGVCIKVTAQIYRRKMQGRRMQASYLCTLSYCNCDNIDLTTSVGTIVCTMEGDTPDGYCRTSSGVEYCFTRTTTLYYSGSQYYDNYVTCVNFTKGPFDSICTLSPLYGSTTCEIEMDGVMCLSCAVGPCAEQETPLLSPLIWNCSGTTLDSSGNECEGDRFLPFLQEGTSAPSAPPAVTVEPETTAPVTAAPATAAPVTAAPVIVPTAAPVTEVPSSVTPVTEPPTPPATEPPTVSPVPVTNPPTVFPVTEPPVAPRPDTIPPTGDGGYTSMSMSFDARRMLMDEADLFEFGRRDAVI